LCQKKINSDSEQNISLSRLLNLLKIIINIKKTVGELKDNFGFLNGENEELGISDVDLTNNCNYYQLLDDFIDEVVKTFKLDKSKYMGTFQ
jgi:hypothetical protein